jgi:hypothetical protein
MSQQNLFPGVFTSTSIPHVQPTVQIKVEKTAQHKAIFIEILHSVDTVPPPVYIQNCLLNDFHYNRVGSLLQPAPVSVIPLPPRMPVVNVFDQNGANLKQK